MLVGRYEKQPWETKLLTIDFATELAKDSDGISGATVTARNRTTGADASEILDGMRTITGTKVIQSVQAGVSGQVYRLEMRVTTTLGSGHEGEIDVVVREV